MSFRTLENFGGPDLGTKWQAGARKSTPWQQLAWQGEVGFHVDEDGRFYVDDEAELN